MKYSENLDYLVAAITYLGTHTYYWARTPEHMARELSLDEAKLTAIFDGFPSIFRKSLKPSKKSKSGQHFYSLQARYALRDGEGTSEPEQVSYIKPLVPEQMEQVLGFILKASQMEFDSSKTNQTNKIAIGAAITSAATAVVVAVISIYSN